MSRQCLRRVLSKQFVAASLSHTGRLAPTSWRVPLVAQQTLSRRSATTLASSYFLDNDRCLASDKSHEKPRIQTLASAASQSASTASRVPHDLKASTETDLPHRRRRRKHLAQGPEDIPLDASSQLSNLSADMPKHSIRQKAYNYLALSKPRLTFLMVLTTTTAYSLFPVAVTPFSTSLSLSPLILMNLTTGTALASACANTLNMYLEPVHDAKMTRTRTRPLVRGLLTPMNALAFAAITGTSGVALLFYGVNSTVAFLGALNIFLYAGVYTPMKRISIANTWAGAVVGGIPPLMGWAAAAGQASLIEHPGWRELLFDPYTSSGGWLLAALLFAWQFPHFNAIAHTIRHEYANAGYKMLASVNPRKNGLIALRYALAMVPICAGLCYVGVVNWAFLGTSSVVNGWVIREAYRFWRAQGERGTARGLFWASVWHLPLLLVLCMIHKQGLWERLFQGGLGEDELAQYLQEEVDEEASDLASNGEQAETPAKRQS